MFTRCLIGFFLAALSVSGFASTFVFGSALTKTWSVSPEVFSFLRFLIASSAMLAVGGATPEGRRQLLAPTRRDWRSFLWLGPVGTSIMAWCVFMGCARVSTANASMADALTPLMIFSVAALRARRIDLRELIGLAAGFFGALLVVQIVTGQGLALEAYSIGDVYILLAAATWGVYTVFGREQIKRLGSMAFTTWTMLIGTVSIGVVLPFCPSVWPKTVTAWFMTIGLGLVSTLLPFWTWNAAQKYLPMPVLGVTAYFTPVVAIALGWMLLKESATNLQWLGTAFIVLSAVLTTRQTQSEKTQSN